MNSLSLRQLHYFQALARQGHFGRAAEVCAISQPALSMQIKELEMTLGVTLIERGARHTRLTAFGEEAARRVEAILRQVDELSDLARAAQGRLAGALRLGMIPTIAPYLLPKLADELARSHPGLDLQLREAQTSKLIEELTEGRLDVAILALPIAVPGLAEVTLFKENFVLVRPRADEGRPAPPPDALHDMKLLLLEEGHCFRDQALAFCHMQSTAARDVLDASSLSTLVQMVSAGMGVTLIPDMAVAVETRSAPVSVVRFREPQPSRIVGMVWRRTSPLAAQFLLLSGEIAQAVAAREATEAGT